MQDLELEGIAIFVDNTPAAFSLGEVKNDEYLLHFAKGNIHYKGIYQYLFKETAKAFSATKWINMEQDLGKPQLNKMKRSYYPDHLLKKYTVHKSSRN